MDLSTTNNTSEGARRCCLPEQRKIQSISLFQQKYSSVLIRIKSIMIAENAQTETLAHIVQSKEK